MGIIIDAWKKAVEDNTSPEVLQENVTKDKKNISNLLSVFYFHMLKWGSQKNKQSKSWIKSIRNSSIAISNGGFSNTAIIGFTATEFRKAFNDGIKKCINETGIRKIPDEIEMNVFYIYDNFDNIFNFDMIYQFLIDNKYENCILSDDEIRKALYNKYLY